MQTYYTYSEEDKRLARADRVIVVHGQTIVLGTAADFAQYLSAYPLADPTPAPTPPEGKVAVPDGYEVQNGAWVRVYRYEDAPPAPPRTFSKLRVVAALMEAGVWPQVKAYIETAGLYDLFLAAQDFREDNEYFTRGRAALQSVLGWDDAQVEAVLAASVAGGEP